MKKLYWGLAALLALGWQRPGVASESAWVINSGGLYTELQSVWGWHQTETPQQEFTFLNRLEMGFLENASFFISAPFRSLSMSRNNLLLTNNGLTDIHLGTYIQLLSRPVALTLKTALKIPTGYNPAFLPSIGDRQFDAELGLLAGYTGEDIPWYVQGGVSYRLRTPYDSMFPLTLATPTRKEKWSRPSDEITGLLEGGIWIVPSLLVALENRYRLGLNQSETYSTSQITLNPLLAWRVSPNLDVSLQAEQVLWAQNAAYSTSFGLGAHFRFNTNLTQGVGLRGGLTVPQ